MTTPSTPIQPDTGRVKIWHVRATRKAAEILGIPEADITREMYAAFEGEVWPIYEVEQIEIGEDLARLLTKPAQDDARLTNLQDREDGNGNHKI